ncbi:MAG: aminopeptidase P family protein [Bacteroidetes bacterium]|nr:MAG: aminopeptidase P family protein [Bacteroidota bacterium]
MMTTEKIGALRSLMQDKGFDAYIVPPTDPHQSEYIADHWKTREWLSGFTGSAGTVVITQDFAGLWTDSRYFIQAEKELEGSGIGLVKLTVPHAPEYIDWLGENLHEGQIVGIDGKVFAQSLVEMLKKQLAPKGIKFNCAFDLPGQIWQDRPPLSPNEVIEHDLKYAGKSRTEKIALVRHEMENASLDYHLVTSLDDIAWLFNLRGSDVDYNPVFTSYAIVSQNSAVLFIDQRKLAPSLKEKLEDEGLEIKPYDEIAQYLTSLPRDSSLSLNSVKTSHHIYLGIPPHCIRVNDISIPAKLKACKDETEIKHIRNALVKDGVALVKFFRWLEENVEKGEITEITLDEKLTEFRQQQPGYMGNSFGTIAGYKDHGAIIHYSATPESAYTLKPEGLLLLDSGGQYVDGTTDITRTICLGKPTDEQILDYTLVLKGLIKLSMAYFPEGTKGFHLDALARFPLWQHGKNYGHGTGHGVGYFLNVHEGPQGVTPNPAVSYPLREGMLQSNEPGFYSEGKYGIRLENLIVVIPHIETQYGKFLQFETLTLFPMEINLIDLDLLTPEEKGWLNRYHKKVFQNLSPRLSPEDNQWLLEKTREVKY